MTRTLIADIARCPIVDECLIEQGRNYPCATVVRTQQELGIYPDQHQLPEPWSGRIDSAPILFVSSNPSISMQDVYPTTDWQDDEVVDFFQNRFGGGRKDWIQDGNRGLARDGSYLRATAFWSAVRRRAEELLQRPSRPGMDYALTEIVHCKSRHEAGVVEALPFCSDLYLKRVMELSAARVVVVLGRLAAVAVRPELDADDKELVLGPMEWLGKDRIIAFLPHPNARGVRSFAKCLLPDDLQRLRESLMLTK